MKNAPKTLLGLDSMKSKKVNIYFQSWNFVCDEVTGMIDKGKKICGRFWAETDNMLEDMRMKTFEELDDSMPCNLNLSNTEQIINDSIVHINTLIQLNFPSMNTFISHPIAMKSHLTNFLQTLGKVRKKNIHSLICNL